MKSLPLSGATARAQLRVERGEPGFQSGRIIRKKLCLLRARGRQYAAR